jgi:hypothetical protein
MLIVEAARFKVVTFSSNCSQNLGLKGLFNVEIIFFEPFVTEEWKNIA